VAPEHVAKNALHYMGKPQAEVFDRFRKMYQEVNKELGRNQYLVPYFMTSHPGCGLSDAIELAEYVRDLGFQPEQVQDFIPTPGSISTAMYYSGIDPLSGQDVVVVKAPEKRSLQRALLQYKKPENRQTVIKALQLGKREDLMGNHPKALIGFQKQKTKKPTRRSGFRSK
ncbi:MAG: DUF3362 domain-containing protein, partial [Petrimonas sp.]|nr:DUF3362 domain-containing protein [Petrimonas sp.]